MFGAYGSRLRRCCAALWVRSAPVYGDDVVGRAGLSTRPLGVEKMKITDVLVLKAQDLPRAAIAASNRPVQTRPKGMPRNSRSAVIEKSTTGELGAFMDCVRTNGGAKRAGCIASKNNDTLLARKWSTVSTVPQPSSASILQCSDDDAAKAALKKMAQCAEDASDQRGVARVPVRRRAARSAGGIAGCVTSTLGAARIECLWLASPGGSRQRARSSTASTRPTETAWRKPPVASKLIFPATPGKSRGA